MTATLVQTENHQKEREVPFGRPWIDDADRQAVLEVLNGHILTHGPKGKEFEAKFEKFIQGGHAVTTSSCMAALHLATYHFGFKPGDEIIVPAQTHVATVHAVELVGAKPVFVDCELTTGNIDIAQIESKINKNTRGIIVVHFAGIPVEMDKILELANKYNLKVIEDCALAVGGLYQGKHVGLFGDVGCFSFYPVKHMTTAEGGMLISHSEKIAKEIAHFRAFSVDRTHQERKIPGVYDVTGVGLNYRMSELQAALGCSQLDKIHQNLKRRKDNFTRLKSLFIKIENVSVLDAPSKEIENSHYCMTIILEGDLSQRRNEIVNMLTERKIGCSVYYPSPVPRMNYYQKKYGYNASLYPNAETISDHSISLPVGPHLSLDDMDYIAEQFSYCMK